MNYKIGQKVIILAAPLDRNMGIIVETSFRLYNRYTIRGSDGTLHYALQSILRPDNKFFRRLHRIKETK